MKTQIVLKSFDALSFDVLPAGAGEGTVDKDREPITDEEALKDCSRAAVPKQPAALSRFSPVRRSAPVAAIGPDNLRADCKRTETHA